MMMIMPSIFADISFRAIPRWLFGSCGSPLPLYNVLSVVICQESKSTSSLDQNFLIRSVYSSIVFLEGFYHISGKACFSQGFVKCHTGDGTVHFIESIG